MLIVRIFYKDGTEDVKEVHNVADICLDNVQDIRIIKDEKVA